MLSRVADNLYWMSRYLERAEHTTRVLGVTLLQMLDHDPRSFGSRWTRMFEVLYSAQPKADGNDPATITRLLTLDSQNPISVINCISSARENARQVREQISSEMWEQINRLYLRIRSEKFDAAWQSGIQDFLTSLKNESHLFQGITDGTMTHSEGWRFIQLGRSIERAGATARLLDVYYRDFGTDPSEFDYSDWVALLKSCTAFEAYCKVYTAELRPDSIAEFLLLNAHFPRSVRFAADRIQQGMQAISHFAGMRSAGRAERLAGRLRASLDYGQVDEIMAESMHAYLENIERQCAAIHSAVYQEYIAYPVENALSAS